MKNLPLFAAFSLALVFAISGCASVTKDIQIETARDGRVDLSSFKTFGWHTSGAILSDQSNRWVQRDYNMGAELKHLIGRELRAAGFSEVVDEPADLMVAFIVVVDMDSIQIVEDRSENISTIEEIPEGAIYVELLDPKTDQAVWVGLGVAEVKGELSDVESKERLDYAISTMFDSLSK